ncbi:conserved hypothetical protein [Clostridium neonatale]|uniref:hypothetical protein n=1 Tax=Clostridium neonatale TaxID=137838 RepID=UPI00291BBF52|nr:hypothetical protein [Clostridium neonatale]CAI3605221.1 conserved hypothetical protein [Clostridium neonatale]
MPLDELNKLEREINQSYAEAMKNIQDHFKDNLSTRELKIEITNSAIEILENSLRMIKEQKQKLRGEI